MEVWKGYTTEDTIVTEKSVEASKPETINSCWRKLGLDVHDFQVYNRANQGNRERDHGYYKKGGRVGWVGAG